MALNFAGSNFCVFCGFFRYPPKKFPPIKITAKNFPAKIYPTVDILMVDIGYGVESDSEDEGEYRLEDENAIDNPVNNASSGNVVALDPSPEQSATRGVDGIVTE